MTLTTFAMVNIQRKMHQQANIYDFVFNTIVHISKSVKRTIQKVWVDQQIHNLRQMFHICITVYQLLFR